MGGKPSTSTPADQRLAANKLSDSQRQTLADKGQAMPSGAFPIRNRADLAKAIMAIGRAKDPQARTPLDHPTSTRARRHRPAAVIMERQGLN